MVVSVCADHARQSEDELAFKVATACRVLGHRGLVDGVLGHVSARVGDGNYLIRCRGDHERGVALTESSDIRRIDLTGQLIDGDDAWSVPKEVSIHTALMNRRPEVGAVVHAHPRSALLAGLADIVPRPVFGAFNIPAMRMALGGVSVYPRAVLISRLDLAEEMMQAMGDKNVCILRGHGITVAGPSVEAATVAAVNLNELLSVAVELARLGAEPPDLPASDFDELPDLGEAFNDGFAWLALVAELEAAGLGVPRTAQDES